jgi:undecaprenyl diphosphate synthase
MSERLLQIPTHVGIIVDGNGRWAQGRGLSRSLGHKAGADNLEKIVTYAFECGIKVLSLYIFSSENFKRDVNEVEYLMKLFVNTFKQKASGYKKKNIKVVFSGRREPLNKNVLEAIDSITEETKKNTGGIVNFCLNYSGQYEIIDAIKKIRLDDINIDELDVDTFSHYMYQDLPLVDLIIRTSGEQRISNFMLWQCSYAEFYFTDTYFPDFDKIAFDLALLKYSQRDRRFGGINYETKSN